MRKVKGISYNPIKDKEVMDHIDKQQNGSRYILNLVKKDMEVSNIDDYIKEQVDKHLKEIADKMKNPSKT